MVKISKNPKDWYKNQLVKNPKEKYSYREKLAAKYGWTTAGMYDLVANSFYDKGKLKSYKEVFKK